ncbi:uncharacterized protein LOC124356334 isoform X4 [Homalodisca vitripennis]|uniref:uncharacterized protein LOC124356334 isoform X4 n=1 Tax=Homalodisca vitripennis TaxID=197043 RepID=UPI001EEAEE6B|nr:uncharacterized protein LOC124356334 isoform X4 [Homalodisca vitripennis]
MEETITNELSKYSLVVTPSEEETQERNSRPAAGIEAVVPERKSGEKQMLKVARYMNTYRLEAKRPFNAESVRPLLREILTPGPGRGPLRAQQHQQVGGQTSRARSVPRSNSSTSTDTR